MGWPPQIGEVLPRATDAWCERAKLVHWILSEDGHGAEWERVMHVALADAEEVWGAISTLAATAKVTGLRDLGRFGFNCEVDGPLTIGKRSAIFRTIGTTRHPEQRRAL